MDSLIRSESLPSFSLSLSLSLSSSLDIANCVSLNLVN